MRTHFLPLRIFYFVTVLLSGMPLSGCENGASSGGNSDVRVISRFPEKDASNVVKNAEIRIEFSAELLVPSVGASAFKVYSNRGQVEGAVSYDDTTLTMTFIPKQPLSRGVTYTVLINGVTDLLGNTVLSNSWQFTTVDGVWGLEGNIGFCLAGRVCDIGGVNPQIAIDKYDNAIMVFGQYDNVNASTHIFASRSVAGGDWSQPQRLVDSNSPEARDPKVAIDDAGNAIAVWYQQDVKGAGATFDAWYSQYNATTDSWSTPNLLEGNLGDAYSPEIAISRDGIGVAVWRQVNEAGTEQNIKVSKIYDGVVLEMFNKLDTRANNNARSPKVAIDSTNNVFVVWQEKDIITGGPTDVVARRFSLDLNRVDLVAALEADVDGATAPQIAIDKNDDVIVVWTQFDGTRRNIMSNRYTQNVGWLTDAVLIENDNAGSAVAPQIAIDGQNNAIVVWQHDDGKRDNIMFNRYDATSKSWGSASLIENDDVSAASKPQIAVDADGNALAIWLQSDGVRNNVTSNRYIANVGWGEAKPIEVIDNSGIAPQIAIDKEGAAWAVWFRKNSANDLVVGFNRFE